MEDLRQDSDKVCQWLLAQISPKLGPDALKTLSEQSEQESAERKGKMARKFSDLARDIRKWSEYLAESDAHRITGAETIKESMPAKVDAIVTERAIPRPLATMNRNVEVESYALAFAARVLAESEDMPAGDARLFPYPPRPLVVFKDRRIIALVTIRTWLADQFWDMAWKVTTPQRFQEIPCGADDTTIMNGPDAKQIWLTRATAGTGYKSTRFDKLPPTGITASGHHIEVRSVKAFDARESMAFRSYVKLINSESRRSDVPSLSVGIIALKANDYVTHYDLGIPEEAAEFSRLEKEINERRPQSITGSLQAQP